MLFLVVWFVAFGIITDVVFHGDSRGIEATLVTCAYLRLMVGVCDLKPVIFWLTVFEQVELAQRFEKLPFSLVGNGKPSL